MWIFLITRPCADAPAPSYELTGHAPDYTLPETGDGMRLRRETEYWSSDLQYFGFLLLEEVVYLLDVLVGQLLDLSKSIFLFVFRQILFL